MDFRLMDKALEFSRRRRKWLILLGVFSVSGYGVYKVYHLPTVVKKRRRFMKLLDAMVAISEMVCDSTETISVVSRDLKDFLKSDSDEIPNTLKQISKVARSKDFTESLIRVSEAVTVGISQGYKMESRNDNGNGLSELRFTDRLMERVISPAGSGFVSVVVGSFARNLVLRFYSDDESVKGLRVMNKQPSSSHVPTWLSVACNDKCKELIADCMQKFVSTAVEVYLNRTMNVNTYDEIFAGLTNPKHENNMREVLVSMCNGAVETLVKTSHQVLTNPNPNPNPNSNPSSTSRSFVIHESKGTSEGIGDYLNKKPSSQTIKMGDGIQNLGWINMVSSTMAIPSNKKFVSDVTGRLTLETIKSIVEFLLGTISDGLKSSFHVAHTKVVDKGLQVIQYVGAKSSVIVTICIALYLHLLNGTEVRLHA